MIGKRNLDVTEKGAVIFVGNHANQFLDPAILVATAQRPIGFLTAAVSMERPFIGHCAKMLHAIPVVRPQDLARQGDGTISVSQLVVTGHGTRFTEQVEAGDALKVSGQPNAPSVDRVVSDTELILKSALEHDVTKVAFKVWPKLDHGQVYERVWQRLGQGGAIGIFPEGGSHDNPHLIPLKAGVTLMALGAMDKYTNLSVKIVPCGLNYFHGHRFRSHVMVEYGQPIEIPWQLVLEYRKNKRAACEKLLETIESRLRQVTLNYPSFHAMEQITLARRLYQSDAQLSADDYLKLQRRFTLFFVTLRDNPEVQDALRKVDEYDQSLHTHGLKDYEIHTLQSDDYSMYLTLILRFVVLCFILLLSIPGFVLNAPLGMVSRILSRKEARRALQKSEVKVKAQDVIASYKVLVALVVVPVAWTIYFILFSLIYGLKMGLGFIIALPCVSYAAIRMLEQGVQIWRSSLPLLRSLLRSHFVEAVTELKVQRQELVKLIRGLVNKMMPLMGKEFADDRVLSGEVLEGSSEGSRVASVIGVTRRTYKEKKTDAIQDSFLDFASDFDDVKKPSVLGTSVEMERLRLFKKAEEELDEKSPRVEKSPRAK